MTEGNAIVALTTKSHRYTFWNHLNSPLGMQTRPLVRMLTYQDLLTMKTAPAAHYIFADIERLEPARATTLARVWEALDKSGMGMKLLNHPTRTLRRYELLRTLYEEGINPFNVYRVTDLRKPEKYPVFIRTASEHDGAMSDLLHNEAELDAALRLIHKNDTCREDLIIVEFCDTADSLGIYRKYSVFRLGNKLIPRHQLASKSWMLKHPDLVEHRYLEEETAFLDDKLLHERIMTVFELAHVDYGRIDFSLQQGKLRVWEINTNPMLSPADDSDTEARWPVHKRFSDSFHQAVKELVANSVQDSGVANG